MLVDHLLA